MVNPLGSKVKKHEVGNFCYTIQNLPPNENSLYKNIFPFAIVRTQLLKEYGFDFVFKPFMDEIKV